MTIKKVISQQRHDIRGPFALFPCSGPLLTGVGGEYVHFKIHRNLKINPLQQESNVHLERNLNAELRRAGNGIKVNKTRPGRTRSQCALLSSVVSETGVGEPRSERYRHSSGHSQRLLHSATNHDITSTPLGSRRWERALDAT